jgi:hypothetical protein
MAKQNKLLWHTKFAAVMLFVVDFVLSLTSRLALIQAYAEKAKSFEWFGNRACLFSPYEVSCCSGLELRRSRQPAPVCRQTEPL